MSAGLHQNEWGLHCLPTGRQQSLLNGNFRSYLFVLCCLLLAPCVIVSLPRTQPPYPILRREQGVRNSWVCFWEQNKMSRALRLMFGGEEVRLWPPPLFSIILIVTNVAIFISHLFTFIEESQGASWNWRSIPWPQCSVLIYNTFLRHQVYG